MSGIKREWISLSVVVLVAICFFWLFVAIAHYAKKQNAAADAEAIAEQRRWLDEAPDGSEFISTWYINRDYALTHGWRIKSCERTWTGIHTILVKQQEPRK